MFTSQPRSECSNCTQLGAIKNRMAHLVKIHYQVYLLAPYPKLMKSNTENATMAA